MNICSDTELPFFSVHSLLVARYALYDNLLSIQVDLCEGACPQKYDVMMLTFTAENQVLKILILFLNKYEDILRIEI